eukprot:CAMPEP_0204616096 /NCGR_PEP_ID=MMETSP0717-20131115/3419_1 /ASSEMBLY_ACC=CAM_ASM_000666 /TAXON_ID=230516 /ORGANISM="Chaetoceros curvisetus" /LENGTH=343 /DNA_ID=CAMNT_0051629215 /DNA_START=137 /DNA_END=1168 /DNA_ORIENTATION=+
MSETHTHWTDDDIESMLKTTLFAVAVGVIVLFVFFPRRDEQPQPQRRRQAPQRRNRQGGIAGGTGTGTGNGRIGGATNAGNGNAVIRNDDDDEDGIQAFLKQYTRRPPHHVDSDVTSSSSAHRNDGILPFRLTRASIHESKEAPSSSTAAEGTEGNNNGNGNDKALENRKARARVFAKLFTSKTNIAPPSRGGTMVISIPVSVVMESTKGTKHAKLTQVLFSLGTYYNLFVMVAVDNDEKVGSGVGVGSSSSASDYIEDKKRSDDIVHSLFSNSGDGESLPKDVLPSHRIVITQSVPSRIAFVRSFPKNPDVVIGFDDDEDLMTQLTKFGYNVMLHKSSVFGA